MYLKRILRLWWYDAFSGERRRKPTELESLKFCDKKHELSRIGGWRVSTYSVLHSLEPMSFSVITAWAPDFQNFKNWIWDLEEITRVWQELGSWTFLFSNWGVLSLLKVVDKWLSKHCHQRCYWKFGDLSFHQTLSKPGDAPSKELRYLPFSKTLCFFTISALSMLSSLSWSTFLLHLSKLPFPQYPTLRCCVLHESLNLRQKLTF